MSITEQTLSTMDQLRMPGAHHEYNLMLSNPSLIPQDRDAFLARILQAEVDSREQARLKRNYKSARLRISNACVENLDFSVSRGLDREVLSNLSHCGWIDRSQHVIITGPSGTGKTHVACALADQAIRHGYTVLYKRFTQLLEELDLAEASGELAKVRARIAKVNLLALDDLGISPMTAKSRLHLLDVIEQRAGNGSLIITAQLPISGWYDYIGEPTIADAILDRVIHRAHKIELRGESMRKLRESV